MLYDNVQDARAKLQGTFCYYKGRAVNVREVDERDLNGSTQISCLMSFMDDPGSRGFRIPMTDPEFAYMQFNLGYMNVGPYAVWYYRIPLRQYRQGLRRDQCSVRDESGLQPNGGHHGYDLLGNNAHTADMMMNKYPTFEEAIKKLSDGQTIKIAFHRNFALFRDKLRRDYVLEYKGVPTAFGSTDAMFKCADNMGYLRETLQELNIKVA